MRKISLEKIENLLYIAALALTNFAVPFLDGMVFFFEAVAAWAFENFVLTMRVSENGIMKSKKQLRECTSREGKGLKVI